jgi:hypothetical protein
MQCPPTRPGRKLQKNPFSAGGFEYFVSVDSEATKDNCQFVHQRDVEISLCVLDNFCGFGQP